MQFSTVLLALVGTVSAQYGYGYGLGGVAGNVLGGLANGVVGGITNGIVGTVDGALGVAGPPLPYGPPGPPGPPREFGGDYATGRYCRDLNVPSARLPPNCQAYCNARGRTPWWC